MSWCPSPRTYRGLLCHRAARSALETRLSGQPHSCIDVIFTHSRVVCRPPCLRSSRSPRPLPRITNHRSAPPFPRIVLQTALFADKRRGALLVRSFGKGSLGVSADVRIRVSFLPSILVLLVPCIASLDCSACSPLLLAHMRSTIEPMPITTEAHRQLKSKAMGSSPSSTRTCYTCYLSLEVRRSVP